jgi:acyl carrier protein
MNLVDTIDRRFARFGVRGYTLAPGYVATRFSASYRQASDAALLPGEVAEALVTMVRDPTGGANTIFLEPGRASRGQFVFQRAAPDAAPSIPNQVPNDDHQPEPSAGLSPDRSTEAEGGVAKTIRAVLRLPSASDLRGGGLGLTPGWDSLKHIEIIVAIEALVGLRFKSSEIEATHRYDDLVALCARKTPITPPASEPVRSQRGNGTGTSSG